MNRFTRIFLLFIIIFLLVPLPAIAQEITPEATEIIFDGELPPDGEIIIVPGDFEDTPVSDDTRIILILERVIASLQENAQGNSLSHYLIQLVVFALIGVILILAFLFGGALRLFRQIMNPPVMSALEGVYDLSPPTIQQGIRRGVHSPLEVAEEYLKRTFPGAKITVAVDLLEDVVDEISDGIPVADKPAN